jgi:hypothetical protein
MNAQKLITNIAEADYKKLIDAVGPFGRDVTGIEKIFIFPSTCSHSFCILSSQCE